jgi:hypothetical protein
MAGWRERGRGSGPEECSEGRGVLAMAEVEDGDAGSGEGVCGGGGGRESGALRSGAVVCGRLQRRRFGDPGDVFFVSSEIAISNSPQGLPVISPLSPQVICVL